MTAKPRSAARPLSVMVLGVGAFAHSTTQILKEDGAAVATYLTRDYAHYPPSLTGPTFLKDRYPSPAPLVKRMGVDLVIPMSIDWALAPWSHELHELGVPIFCPSGQALRIERERDFARELCQRFGIPFPQAFLARDRAEAQRFLRRTPKAFVLKNPLCSPNSPLHTILCESPGDTRSWLERIDDSEGVFLQEYLGPREAGHIALVSAGELYPLVTNQEYKRAFAGNMGIIAGAPLGGLVEADPLDKHGLARQLLRPLLPWFREVNYHGPIQVTAVHHRNQWQVIEYNARIGVTSGAMILRMLAHPAETLLATGRNQPLQLRFDRRRRFGCSITLAGYGYPYVKLEGPPLPVMVDDTFACDVWWNEVRRDHSGQLMTTGHRIADVVAFGSSLTTACSRAYRNIRKIRSLGGYYRADIGQSLWPPGCA